MDGREFTGTVALTSYPPGGSGGIVGGQLEFSIGRLADGHLRSIVELVGDMEHGDFRISVNPATARFVILELETPNGWLAREHEASSETMTTSNWEQSGVHYIFVDRNVTLSSDGVTETDSGPGWTFTEKIEPFNITFREGWNALLWREFENVVGDHETEGYGLSHADPDHMKWTLWERWW